MCSLGDISVGNSFPYMLSSGYLKAKQYMEEENYDKIISECTKEIESGGRYTAEALLLRATFYLLIGNSTAAQPDLDRVINMQDANVKVQTIYYWGILVVCVERLKSQIMVSGNFIVLLAEFCLTS